MVVMVVSVSHFGWMLLVWLWQWHARAYSFALLARLVGVSPGETGSRVQNSFGTLCDLVQNLLHLLWRLRQRHSRRRWQRWRLRLAGAHQVHCATYHESAPQ